MPLYPPPPPPPVSAACSGSLTLPASLAYADVTGCAVTLSIGNWLVIGVFDFTEAGAGDVGDTFAGRLVTGTATCTITNSTALALWRIAALNNGCTASQVYWVNVTVAGTVKLQAAKAAAGAGTSVAGIIHTTITAVWLGQP